VDGLTADYAPDVVLYDVKPPYRLEGPAGIRRTWEQCLPYFPAKFVSERAEERLVVGADAAFYHGLHHVRPLAGHGGAGMTWIRVTVCYRKVEGRWLVAHEHVSVPFDPRTGQVVFITEPGK
jgi:ketosteroid isomerase-like protein